MFAKSPQCASTARPCTNAYTGLRSSAKVRTALGALARNNQFALPGPFPPLSGDDQPQGDLSRVSEVGGVDEFVPIEHR